MALAAFDPTDRLLQLQESLDRLLREPSLGLGLFGVPTRSVFPPINVFADKEGFVVRAEVPGVSEEKLDVSVEPGRLTISGVREAEAADPNGSYYRRERPHGRFSRSIVLPEDLDGERASAEYKNGILTIRIPKREQAKPRQISIVRA